MFNFNFGNKSPNIKQYAIITVILSLVIGTLSNCTKVNENFFWDLLDEIQRKYFPKTILNEFIIKDSQKLQRRVERDVDSAIQQATPEYDRIIQEENKKYQPRYVEEPRDGSLCYTDECKALGPPIRMCSSWVSDCN